MKLRNLAVAFLIVSGVTYAQKKSVSGTEALHALGGQFVPPTTPQEHRVLLVKWLMSFSSPLENGIVQLHRMGDEAAANAAKIMSSRPPLTEAEQLTLLDIVRISFEHPN